MHCCAFYWPFNLVSINGVAKCCLQKFQRWMEDEVFRHDETFTFVTCGDWDLKRM